MNTTHIGRAWVYTGPVTTDHILPGKYLDLGNDEVGRYAMSGIDQAFSTNVAAGDILVSDRNFGAGSGRENAVTALKHAGVGAIIAESFGRVFFRNCINHGLIAAVVATTAGIEPGDQLEVDLDAHTLRNLTKETAQEILNLRGTARAILQAGGIIAFTKLRIAEAP